MKLKTIIVIGLIFGLLCGSMVSAINPLRFGTDGSGNTWYGYGRIPAVPSSYDFIVGKYYNATYYAINCTDGRVQFSGLVFHTVMNNVITELQSNKPLGNIGGKIFLKSGDYDLTGTINLKPNTWIEGTSMTRTAKKSATTIGWAGGANKNGFYYDGTAGDGFTLKNLELRSYYDMMNAWICSHGGAELSVVDTIDTMGSYYKYCIFYEGMDTGIIKNCDFYGAQITAIWLGTQHLPTFHSCNTVIVDNCFIRNNREGIFVGEGSFKNVIQNSKFQYNKVCSINISKNMSQVLRYGAVETSVLNCYFENEYKNASIFLYASEQTSIRDCYSYGNLIKTGTILPNGTTISNCYILTPGVESDYLDYPLKISGNNTVIENTVCNGIQIDAGKNGLISHCDIMGGKRHYSFSYINQGIIIGSTCKYWKVENCHVENVNTTGIQNYGTGCIVSGCVVKNISNTAAFGYGIKGYTVRECSVNATGTSSGIYVQGNGASVTGCSVYGVPTNYYISVNGASTLYGGHISIANNFIFGDGTKTGINFDNCFNSSAIGNKINNTVNSVRYVNSRNIIVSLNVLKAAVSDAGGNINIVVHDNLIYKTESYGTCAIAGLGTSIIVNHNLSATPKIVICNPMRTMAGTASYWYVDTFTATQFTVHTNAAIGATAVEFSWYARV